MIGVIGPHDSVELTAQVAAELGLQDSVLTRAYEVADEAPALAKALDAVCHVLLFTGQVPYALAERAGGLRAILDFVPHGGVDLYRALVLVLRGHGGRLPKVSVDTIDRPTVEETYRDLGAEPPQHLLALDADEGGPGIRTAEDVTKFHMEHYRNGDVELCLTCLGSVSAELDRAGVPVVRVEHTRATLRDSLMRALLTDRLTRSEATQIAEAVIDLSELHDRAAPAGSPYESDRIDLRLRQQVIDFAERLQGTITGGNGSTFTIHATRGAIEREIARLRAGHSIAAAFGRASASVPVGFGVGESAASAEENARRALALSRRADEPYLVLTDGTVVRVGREREESAYKLRETDQQMLALARDLGLGPLTVSRLLEAIRRLDPAAVTARDLARAYGVAPRSALRLLTRLERAGVATVLGQQVAPRAGRPQTVYRVDLNRLLNGG